MNKLSSIFLIYSVFTLLLAGPKIAFTQSHNSGDTNKSGIHRKHLRERPAKLDTSTVRLSVNGHFKVAYRSIPSPTPLSRIHRIELSVYDSQGKPINDAIISLKGDMPEHGHGMATKPTIKRGNGDGKYIVYGLKFHMPGWWEIVFDIRSGKLTDKVIFNQDLL